MREAGTPPHFSRFPGRAGTPHPPLCQPSGTEEMLNELRSCAGQYELSRRLAWLPRGREVVLRLLLGISSECGALLNTITVATTKLSRTWGTRRPVAAVLLSRWTCFDDKLCCSQQCCRFHGARHMLQRFPAPAWELLIVVCTVFGRVIGFGRAKCA